MHGISFTVFANRTEQTTAFTLSEIKKCGCYCKKFRVSLFPDVLPKKVLQWAVTGMEFGDKLLSSMESGVFLQKIFEM